MDDSTELTVVLHSKNQSAIELAAATILAALVGVIVSVKMPIDDWNVFERLTYAFGGHHTVINDAHFSDSAGILTILGFALAGFAQTYIIYKIAGPPRYIASIMLIAMAVVYQGFVYDFSSTNTHPLGFIGALIVGALSGIAMRQFQSQRRKEESTYYELKLKNRELLETRLELLKQDEVERRILAADLHDQVLNDLKQVATRFERYTKEPDPENAEKIAVLTAQVMREIREVMDSLSPSVLEHLGLAAAIEDCLRRGSERANFRTRIKSRVENEELDCLSMVEKGLLYRLVQESITNICKHAGATTVRATLESEEDELVIKVIDDGKGIDPAMARGDSRGLKYMRYRADLIGATIAWKPGENGKGTSVEIRINLGDRRAAQAAAAQREQVTAKVGETQV
jgi:signal transduction histidine kinase